MGAEARTSPPSPKHNIRREPPPRLESDEAPSQKTWRDATLTFIPSGISRDVESIQVLPVPYLFCSFSHSPGEAHAGSLETDLDLRRGLEVGERAVGAGRGRPLSSPTHGSTVRPVTMATPPRATVARPCVSPTAAATRSWTAASSATTATPTHARRMIAPCVRRATLPGP